ncbi:transglutaminase family protein [Gynuella sp.]|uniref:transglutaminase family protein n=1 Tax=Gynuella sp. TaxID=2969146 RepID=UPI003D0FAFAF
MKYQVRHTTRYKYQESVSHCYNMGYILPRNTGRQTVYDSQVSISPTASQAQVQEDLYGNQAYHFSIETAHDELDVTVVSQLEVQEAEAINLQIGTSCEYSKTLLFKSDQAEILAAREFILESPKIKTSQELMDYAAPSFTGDRTLLAAVMDLTQRIFNDFTYDPEFSNISTPLSEVLKHRRGVCQDFAHLGIACLRVLGYPARYVSGYLETLPPPGQQKLVGADASHAWFAVYSPGEGWFEFDPTNNQMAGVQHITTAWGRDYADVPPLKGVVFGGGESSTLHVAVDVMRIPD